MRVDLLSVCVRQLVGTSFYVRADPRTTIDEVKSKIKNQKGDTTQLIFSGANAFLSGVEVERQKLIYAGKELESTILAISNTSPGWLSFSFRWPNFV